MGPFSKKRQADLDRLLSGAIPEEAGEAGLEEVGRLIRDLRSEFSRPLSPELEASHLKAIMQSVQSTISSGGSLAPERGHPVPGPSTWRNRALRAAGASLALKIAGGAVALAATTGGLAALNALPDPAQEKVADVVEAVSPLDLPGNVEIKPQRPRPTLQVQESLPPQVPPAPVPNSNADFGQEVARDARDGGVEGPAISEAARRQAEERRQDGKGNAPAGVGPGRPEETPGPPANVGPPPGHADQAGPQNGLSRAGETPAGDHIPPAAQPGPPQGAGPAR